MFNHQETMNIMPSIIFTLILTFLLISCAVGMCVIFKTMADGLKKIKPILVNYLVKHYFDFYATQYSDNYIGILVGKLSKDESFSNLLTSVDEIKQSITDAQYMGIMECMTRLHRVTENIRPRQQ